ncbi:Protein FAR1-RELATED SEQUENCE 5 [Glycine soja]
MCMDKDQWTYDYAMSQEVYMDYDYDNEEECGVFGTRDDVLQWARTVAHENGFVAVIMRSDTDIGSRGRSSFVLIGCERSGSYNCRNKEFVRKDTGSRKCGCPFRLRGKPVHGGEGWMVKLICGIHNHELAKSLVGHPYAGRLTKDEKKIIVDMTKSMVKPKNILLTLKEHNANSCTTIKQIYNARSAYRSSIRGADTEMQHLMKLLEHSTYKINRYRLPLLDFVGVTPTAMTFSIGFAYLEAERVNNIVWALERFRDLFLRNDRLPVVIVTDRDLALMNAVKVVFPECTNLLCRFHIDKNVKAKCKSLIGEKNAWDYFAESVQKFQIACSPWPMFIDYAWTNNVMHLGNTTTNRVESAHWDFKRVLQNSVGDLCSVWDAMNNMITLQHVEIKASFETSTHLVGHVYKKTLYKRLLGMVSRDTLNQIASEVDRLRYLGNNPSSCGCVMRSTHDLPCACELSRYTAGSIPVESVHIFWRRLCFSDQGLCETEVSIKEEIETISKRFDELDVSGKVNTKGAPKKPMKRSQRSTKRDPSYWEYVDVFHSVQSSNSPIKRSASCSEPSQPTRIIPMLDQFAPFIQGFIRDVVDVKADGNCGYRSIAALLGMGEDSWPLVCNELIKELGRWSHEYMNLFGGIERFEQLKLSLLVDGFSKVSVDKWMDITEMGYVIASRYNVILVSLSQQQSMTFFPLRSQPPPDYSRHRMICVGDVFGNHFVQVYLKDHCPLPPPALLWSSNCYSQTKHWTTPYISRMQQYTSLMSFKRHYVDLNED